MLNRQAAAAVNHLLEPATWARKALEPFAGAIVAIELGPARLRLAIGPDGMVSAATGADTASLTLSLDLLTAARIVAGDVSARSGVRTQGDDELARATWHVASNLQWDYEDDLSRVTGDVLAHRIGEWLRSAGRASRDSALRAGLAASEYLTEEGRMTPPQAELNAFAEDVDALRDAVARLEQRIAALGR